MNELMWKFSRVQKNVKNLFFKNDWTLNFSLVFSSEWILTKAFCVIEISLSLSLSLSICLSVYILRKWEVEERKSQYEFLIFPFPHFSVFHSRISKVSVCRIESVNVFFIRRRCFFFFCANTEKKVMATTYWMIFSVFSFCQEEAER